MTRILLLSLIAIATLVPGTARAACADLPGYVALRDALRAARAQQNGGLNLEMWATMVDRFGVVCQVVFTGDAFDAPWPGSRLISAQKASTANAFSVAPLALSTANLYSAVQPGGPLFGLQESNPLNLLVAYGGNIALYGRDKDPLVGQIIGGINVFGGGLPLYSEEGLVVGGIGVSGDTSCADHNIAWRVRNALELDYVRKGVAPGGSDQIIYDIANGRSASGYGHPLCGGEEPAVAKLLPPPRRPTP